MNVEEKKFSVEKLVKAFSAGSLLRNPEYQRGEAWSEVQKATFIDSLLRDYPVPALFLHVVEDAGLEDAPAKKFEVVDGQQRLTALRAFKDGKFKLLATDDKSKLRIPKSIRTTSAPWAGKYFAELSPDLRKQFESIQITVFQIGPTQNPDEIRDLFIRLQSGTALSRQQIRDAWPGNLGPFIERLAGKLDKHASHKLFTVVDKRGQRSEEEEQRRDYHVADRQTCAQLLQIFTARERDPYVYPSVSANELDALYHEQTDFDDSGNLAIRFKEALSTAGSVFEKAKSKLGKKTKFRRLDITVTMMYIQDISKGDRVKFDKNAIEALAKHVLKIHKQKTQNGKTTASSTLQHYYDWWRDQITKDIVVRLDPKRAFSPEQQKQIRKRDGDKCAICGDKVPEDEAEYDHYPIPYRDGGSTLPENGRLLHGKCHPRGRPTEDV